MTLPLFYGKPIDTPTGHKWAGYTAPKATEHEHFTRTRSGRKVWSTKGECVVCGCGHEL